MNLHTLKTPAGWQATDNDTFDGAADSEWPSNCIGIGDTEQEAIDDLLDQLERPYSYRPIAEAS